MGTLNLSSGSRNGSDTIMRQRTVNVYPEATPQGPGESARFQRPGLVSQLTVGVGPIRAAFTYQGYDVIVSGPEVYIGGVLAGSVSATGPLRHAVADDEFVLVAGGLAYRCALFSVTLIVDPDLFLCLDVCFFAGRFVYLSNGQTANTTGQFCWSDIGNAQSIAGLAFASAESQPDALVGCVVQGDRMGLFGTRTVEWWYPTTDIDAPYQRSNGQTYDRGLISVKSLVKVDNGVFFVGNDRIVYRTSSVPLIISSFEVAHHLLQVADADVADISAWSLVYNQHTFYILNLPGQGTWAYDVATQTWTEWKTWALDRFRVEVSGENYVGDYSSGTLYKFSSEALSDLEGSEPIERVVSAYIPLNSGYLNNFSIILRCLRGVGLTGDGYGSDPQVEMRFSDGEGRSWSDWLDAPLGMMGDAEDSAKSLWVALGAIRAPGRLIEFRCTDPVIFAPYAAAFNEVLP